MISTNYKYVKNFKKLYIPSQESKVRTASLIKNIFENWWSAIFLVDVDISTDKPLKYKCSSL